MPKTLEKPQDLRVDGEPTATTVNTTWDHSGGKPLDGFYLSWKKQGEPGWTDHKTLPADARNAAVDGLDASTTYEFQVLAFANGGRCGSDSAPDGPLTATTTTNEQDIPSMDITRIDVAVATSTVDGAGTDALVYLGIAGREFAVDSSGGFNDFESGDNKTYTFGERSNVDSPERNDPRNPQLDTADIARHPVYLRFKERGGWSEWALQSVLVTVNPGKDQQVFENTALAKVDAPQWIGSPYGEVIHLSRRTTAPAPKKPGEPNPEPKP